MAINQHSATHDQQIKKGRYYRDVRSTWQIIFEALPTPDLTIIFSLAFIMVAFIFPIFAMPCLIVIVIHTFWTGANKSNRTMPLKKPIELSSETDYNEYIPGRKGIAFGKSKGVVILGKEERTKQELWLTPRDLLTHLLVIGASGAGKTELLVSFCVNGFTMGSGIIYVDAKAGVDCLSRFMTLARIFGRDDCVRIISYLLAGTPMVERTWIKKSNTANPFGRGSADFAATLLNSMLPESGGENSYFVDRARSIVQNVMPALCELRDMGALNITPSKISQFMSVERFIELAYHEYDDYTITIDGEKQPHLKLSEKVTNPIKTFLKQLPNFKKDADGKPKPAAEQDDQIAKQFGFAEGYFAKIMTSLAGKYAHIYEHELAECDPVDCIYQSRIMIVMVPALELEKDEASSLGQIVLAGLKSALALGLGNHTEGTIEQVLDSRPIDVKIPNILIVDEYPAISVPGFAEVATQARSLGTSATFSGQDLSGFMRASEEETDMIFGSTRIKILGTLMETEKTWPRFRALAAQHLVGVNKSFSRDNSVNYSAGSEAQAEMMDRIDIKDLTAQTEGETHIFYHDKILRTQMFYHGLDPEKDLVSHYSIPRMLKIKRPAITQINSLMEYFDRCEFFKERLQSESQPEYTQSKFWKEIIDNVENNNLWPYSVMAPEISGSTSNGNQNTVTPAVTMDSDTSPFKNPLNFDVEMDNELIDEDLNSHVADELQDEQTPEELHPTESDLDRDIDSLLGSNDSCQTLPAKNARESALQADTSVKETLLVNKSVEEEDVVGKYYEIFSKVSNHWVFDNVCNEDGISIIDEYIDGLTAINEELGLSEDNARLESVKIIENIPEIIGGFPSEDVELNEDDFLAALKVLEKKTE